jgi:hypothetical protein
LKALGSSPHRFTHVWLYAEDGANFVPDRFYRLAWQLAVPEFLGESWIDAHF